MDFGADFRAHGAYAWSVRAEPALNRRAYIRPRAAVLVPHSCARARTVASEVFTEAQSFADCKLHIRTRLLASAFSNFWKTPSPAFELVRRSIGFAVYNLQRQYTFLPIFIGLCKTHASIENMETSRAWPQEYAPRPRQSMSL